MNQPISIRSTIAALLIVCGAIPASAQHIESALNTATVLNGFARCDHVLQLIHQHGVNNSVDLACGRSLLHSSPFGGLEVPGAELGDLEIVQVNQINHQNDSCGPRIAVVVRNHSCRKVCNFHVTAVAMLGQILPNSPNATVNVAEVLPGAALEIQLQLPIEALAMGNRNGQIIGFQRLVVAIDSYDELLETNEANNIKAWNVSELAVAEPAAVEAISEPISSTPVETSDTAGSAAMPPMPETTESAPDALRTAIEKIDPQVTES